MLLSAAYTGCVISVTVIPMKQARVHFADQGNYMSS